MSSKHLQLEFQRTFTKRNKYELDFQVVVKAVRLQYFTFIIFHINATPAFQIKSNKIFT